MQHWVQPIRHGTDQADQGFRIGWIESLPTGDAPKRVMAAPLPQLNPVGKLIFQPQLVAGPEHGFTTVQVQGLGGEQQKVELFNASSAEACIARGRGLGHGCDDARGQAVASPGFGPSVVHP